MTAFLRHLWGVASRTETRRRVTAAIAIAGLGLGGDLIPVSRQTPARATCGTNGNQVVLRGAEAKRVMEAIIAADPWRVEAHAQAIVGLRDQGFTPTEGQTVVILTFAGPVPERDDPVVSNWLVPTAHAAREWYWTADGVVWFEPWDDGWNETYEGVFGAASLRAPYYNSADGGIYLHIASNGLWWAEGSVQYAAPSAGPRPYNPYVSQYLQCVAGSCVGGAVGCAITAGGYPACVASVCGGMIPGCAAGVLVGWVYEYRLHGRLVGLHLLSLRGALEMKPTTRAAWREAGIGFLVISVAFLVLIPLTRGNFLFAQTVGLAVMFSLMAWRRWHSWWRALAMASVSVGISLPVSLLVRRLLG